VQGFQLTDYLPRTSASGFLENVTNLWQDFQEMEESVSSNWHVWAEENPHGTGHQ
jgi:hypothetical protein